MALDWPAAMMATHELVVPKSSRMIFPIFASVLDVHLAAPTRAPRSVCELGLSALQFNGVGAVPAGGGPGTPARLTGHRNHGRPQHAVLQPVSLLEHLHDRVRRLIGIDL